MPQRHFFICNLDISTNNVTKTECIFKEMTLHEIFFHKKRDARVDVMDLTETWKNGNEDGHSHFRSERAEK